MSHCGFNFEDTFTGISWVGEQIMNWESYKPSSYSVLVDGYTPQTKFGGVYRNHPVRPSVRPSIHVPCKRNSS